MRGKMKRISALAVIALACAMTIIGCGKKTASVDTTAAATSEAPAMVVQQTETAAAATEAATEESDVAPAGKYASELTGEWIDESLKDQRPIAVMVDDEKTALPHYGLSTADIVYEMMNSTMNDGITRFMVMVKDWESIKQLGSIRSTRPTNLQVFPEWNAILCHDGGPTLWNTIFYENKFVERFSGTFSRVNNGKAREYTEYILPGDLDKNFKSSGYSTTYNEYYKGPHYQFASRSNPNMLTQYADSTDCTHIELPFHHNKPYLDYDAEAGVYKYFQYGQAETDAGNDNTQLAFKNILLQNAKMEQLDEHGYMMYYPTDSDREGLYITNGKAEKVTWTKLSDIDPTRYYDSDGNEIKINVGKTYIAYIPSDEWDNVVTQ